MFSCVLITFLWTHSLEDAPETDNSTYKSSDPTGGSTRTSRDDAEEGTDHNNYGRPPYDVTNVDRDSQTTSSDGQTLPSQRGSSTLVNDQQGRDATTDTSKTSGEDVDNTGASTFDDQPSVNEDQLQAKAFNGSSYDVPTHLVRIQVHTPATASHPTTPQVQFMIRGLPPRTVDLHPFSAVPLLFTTINKVETPLPPRHRKQTWTITACQLLTIKLHR